MLISSNTVIQTGAGQFIYQCIENQDYYNQKMSEGRSHYNALGHCAGKLVRIIYKMLTDNVAFNLA